MKSLIFADIKYIICFSIGTSHFQEIDHLYTQVASFIFHPLLPALLFIFCCRAKLHDGEDSPLEAWLFHIVVAAVTLASWLACQVAESVATLSGADNPLAETAVACLRHRPRRGMFFACRSFVRGTHPGCGHRSRSGS